MVLKPGMICWDLTMGVGGQMNCQDGKCLFKVQSGGKMFILENIREIQSFFFFFFFFSLAGTRNSF